MPSPDSLYVIQIHQLAPDSGSISDRWLVRGRYAFFTLIVIASYTACLTALIIQQVRLKHSIVYSKDSEKQHQTGLKQCKTIQNAQMDRKRVRP